VTVRCCAVTVVEFPTTSMEMQAVADRFDRDGDGFIDYKEFITALRPERGEVPELFACNLLHTLSTVVTESELCIIEIV